MGRGLERRPARCDTFLALGYGPNKGAGPTARFDLKAFNELYERQRVLPDGLSGERCWTSEEIMIAYMPYKVHVHRISTDLWHPWVLGFDRNIFVRDFWKYVDIDVAMRRGAGAEARGAGLDRATVRPHRTSGTPLTPA